MGAEDFISSVWTGGAVLIDEEESFKKALHGGQQYKNSWLLKPSVLLRIMGVKKFGSAMNDLTDKTNMLGGVILMGKDGVLHAETETTRFAYPAAETLLSALKASSGIACTPAQADVA